MNPDNKDPVIVDLASRRRARQKATKAPTRLPGKGEPALGANPHARLIVALLAAALLLILTVPHLM